MRTVPRTTEGNTSVRMFGYRAQLLIDGSVVANQNAAIRSIRLRADGNLALRHPSIRFPALVVAITHSTKSVTNMATTFASNSTSPPTTVHNGAFDFPAQVPNATPFNIRWPLTTPFSFQRSQGNLLIEWYVPTPRTLVPASFDAHVASPGTVASFGVHSALPGPFAWGIGGGRSLLRVGGQVILDVDSQSTRSFRPLLWIGGSRTQWRGLPLPYALGPLGVGFATDSWLHVAPDATHAPPFLGTRATWSFAIPITPSLRGATVFAQSAIISTSGAHHSSRALALTLAGGQDTSLMQMLLNTVSPQATTGWFFATTPGGAVAQLAGSFN